MAEGFDSAPEPTEYQPLTQDRYITGIYTQRSALRDGDTPLMYSRVYGNRYDAIIDGLNCEVSPKGTLIKRPGEVVYNSQIFPDIARFYPFRLQIDGESVIKVLADCPDAVYDATGPATKVVVWTKTKPGKTTFMGVGNTLYFTNGTDLKKWTVSTKTYQPNTAYTPGSFINDPNGNIQVAEGGITIPIVGVSSTNNVTSLQLDTTSPNLPANLRFLSGVNVNFVGLSVATYLNGQTLPIQSAPDESTINIAFPHADFPLLPETGTASTGNGTTCAGAPVWGTTPGVITQDCGQQWICKGNAIQNWGIVGPNVAPTRIQVPLPNTFPAWSANSYYSTCYLILNSANVIQKVTAFGNTGTTEPVWNNAAGTSTNDGTVTWTSQGSAAYAASTAYITGGYIVTTDAFATQYFYQAIVGGVTGGAPPVFPSALGTTVMDGTVIWENVGVLQQWEDITASSVSGSFGIIPLADGKSIVIGCGQNAPNGSAIALPSGYSSSRMAGWASPGTGFSGTSAVTAGVHQSTVSGGVTTSSFQDEHGAFAFNSSTNWAAVAWSDDAAVTITSNLGFTFIEFTTLQGDTLTVAVGSLHDGAAIIVPSGYSATQFINIAGMSGTDNINHIMQGVDACNLDVGLGFTGRYNDNDGNTWVGSGNVIGIFWQTGGGVVSAPVSGGEAILIPTTPGLSLAIIQATATNGGSFGLPAGFGASNVSATCAMSSFTTSGSNHGHGYTVQVNALQLSAFYADGAGNTWSGGANIFAVAALLNTTPVLSAQVVVDANGFLQDIVQSGVSGSAAPLWNQNPGGQTEDKSAIWQNAGAYSIAGTEPTKWAYSYKSSVSLAVSNTSPISKPLTLNAGKQVVLSGPGSPDPQVDTIVIWRIAQGGSTLLFDDEIPAPPFGQMWSFTDTTPDADLNFLITAPVGLDNNPPPTGLNFLAYHMNRIWGAVGPVVQWCTGPDVSFGNGFEAWRPGNSTNVTDTVHKFTPVTLSEDGGLLCHTTADIYCMFGTGTPASPFLPRMYAQGTGLLNYDALDVIGATIHAFTTASKEVSLDPSSGYTETGFPIGDQFKKVTTGGFNEKLFDPNTTMVSWHEQSSGDTALYVSDGANGWFRYAPGVPPDGGFVWSPFAKIIGGISAVQSVETAPGVKTLLIGPKGNGPILMRDDTVNSDNGQLYDNTYATIGSIQLCPPGMIAEVAFITLDSEKVGTPPTCGVIMGEIKETPEVGFSMLEKTSPDPPDLPEAETLYNDRFTLMQSGNSNYPLGRHMQLRIQWSQEDAANELMQHTIYGAKHQERVQQ